MQHVYEAPQNASAELFPGGEFARQTLAVAEADIRKLIHDPVELLTRMVQPALWLLIFGEVFTRVRAIPTGGIPYLDFMTPGILAQNVLFGAIFYGISLIWERDLGIVHKFLVSPAARSALVLGRAISSTVRGLCQMVLVYLLAFLLGVHLRLEPLAVLGVIAAVMLGAAVFSTFSLVAACIVKSRDRFMGIGQVLTMPLFFASNAIYPLSMMPSWLRAFSRVNPLTYQVDALRRLMVVGGTTSFGGGVDFLVLSVAFVLLIGIATRVYPKIIT
ncbi:MAG: ABC transporter permease [Candidatus Acidiferrales bacterium]|jgi:ABC-2 type transport system permease protein